MKAFLLLAALAASAASAQQQASQPAPPAAPGAPSGAENAGLDPNEMICRSQSTLGSRVARRRTCATRAQWLEQNRADRLLTERAQTSRIWCERGAC